MPDNVTPLMKDYMMTFNSDYGHRVLKDLMRIGYVFTGTDVDPEDDRSRQDKNEGRRQLVLEIMSMAHPSKGQDNVILETLLDGEAA